VRHQRAHHHRPAMPMFRNRAIRTGHLVSPLGQRAADGRFGTSTNRSTHLGGNRVCHSNQRRTTILECPAGTRKRAMNPRRKAAASIPTSTCQGGAQTSRDSHRTKSSLNTNVLEFSHIAAKLRCHKHPTNLAPKGSATRTRCSLTWQGAISPVRWESRAEGDLSDAGGYPVPPLFIAIARSTGGRPIGAAVGDRRPDPGTSLAVAKSASSSAGGPPCAPGTPPPRLVAPRQNG
jgi:hypothetical protein